MTIEMKPLGNGCNLACTYCYQEPMRNAGNIRVSKSYDIDLMMEIADNYAKENGSKDGYTMFGGEALLLPKKDLEIFLSNSFNKYGRASLQSNGALIDDDHIEMFKKYNVSVGISIDGANELNSLRVPVKGDTLDTTNKTINNLMRLVKEGISVGVILTVHKLNGTGERLERLMNFIRWMGDMGIKGGNLHMLEVDSLEASKYCLTQEENEDTFIKLAEFFEENSDLQYQPFLDIEGMLRGVEQGACVWNSCDPHKTQAVYGIEGNGQLSNCGMVNKDGIEWVQSKKQSYIRDRLLYETSQEELGCKGCPFFLACNGYCPGSSIDGDWRNKTVYCSSIKKLMKFYEDKIEKDGKVPLSKRKDRILLEKMFFDFLDKGERLSIPRLLSEEIKPVVVGVKGGNEND